MWETDKKGGLKEISFVLISYSITDGHIEPRYVAEKSVLVNSVTVTSTIRFLSLNHHGSFKLKGHYHTLYM